MSNINNKFVYKITPRDTIKTHTIHIVFLLGLRTLKVGLLPSGSAEDGGLFGEAPISCLTQ